MQKLTMGDPKPVMMYVFSLSCRSHPHISRDRLAMLSTTATFSPYSSHRFLQLIQGILGSMKTMRFIDILNDWNNIDLRKKKITSG